jgi:hypothetical protein
VGDIQILYSSRRPGVGARVRIRFRTRVRGRVRGNRDILCGIQKNTSYILAGGLG